MESWAIYKNEERELRDFVNKVAPEPVMCMNDNGILEVRASGVNIRYLPRSQKLIFQGEKQNLALIKHQFIAFIEKNNAECMEKWTLR